MGALTLKSFPFELRGWDIEKFESLDPTDGFGTSTRVYISKQQVIQIEPDHSAITTDAWLSDKGRQFFDGIFGVWVNQNKNLFLKKESWQNSIKQLLKTLCLFEHCAAKTKNQQFLTVVFENLGLETLSLLKILERNFSFLKLKRAENLETPNDLEFNFQLNAVTSTNKLESSTLCLLVANNTRYEGYRLNLNLRQRYLKGNFKCLVLGSLLDLTFQNTTIGTNARILGQIAEGSNFACQDIKTAKKPLLIFGSEFHKRGDSENFLKLFSNLPYTNLIAPRWNGLNNLNSTLSETGMQNLATFEPLKTKDFRESSSFYFINTNSKNIANLKKIAELKLLNYQAANLTGQPNVSKIVLDQSNCSHSSPNFFHLKTDKSYISLPVKMFYENKETFINTEGLIKRTNKLISGRKTREGWKLLRNLQKQLKKRYISLKKKNNNILSFNSIKQSNFINFMNFHFCAIETIDSAHDSLITQNQPFSFNPRHSFFRQNLLKTPNSKLKYSIDDFFVGGKDLYSKNSLVLSKCSKILRTQSTNFF